MNTASIRVVDHALGAKALALYSVLYACPMTHVFLVMAILTLHVRRFVLCGTIFIFLNAAIPAAKPDLGANVFFTLNIYLIILIMRRPAESRTCLAYLDGGAEKALTCLEIFLPEVPWVRNSRSRYSLMHLGKMTCFGSQVSCLL